jgi:tRNA threonylcarbamoyladenosine biosynthesis protein TsaB
MTAWTLGIETIATAGSVALLCGSEVVDERPLPVDLRSARTLAGVVRDMWHQAGKPTISLVGVAHGPGSFTGLRVGVTTAKALAYAWQASLLGVNALDTIAAQTPVATIDSTIANLPSRSMPAELHVVLDAQRKELFLAEFECAAGAWQRRGDDTIVAGSRWLEVLASCAVAQRIVWAAGPGLAKWQNQLPAEICRTEPNHWHPRAATIARLARHRWQKSTKDGPDINELWTLKPHYLRPSYAEEKRTPDQR